MKTILDSEEKSFLEKNSQPREGCHTEIDDYLPQRFGDRVVSGVKDPVDLVPIIQRLQEAGIGKYVTNQTEVQAIAIENAVARAELLDCKLPQEAMDLPGSASYKNRAFLNVLMNTTSEVSESFNSKNYLEIGCHLGATFISACMGNKNIINESYVVDKFLSIHGENTEEEFKENCANFLGEPPKNLFAEDCFSLDVSKIKEKIDVYFYDGPHKVIDHELALTHYESVFNDVVIVIIDDWCDHRVKLGTLRGLGKINYDVAWFHEMPSHQHISDWGCANISRARLRSENVPLLSGFGDPARWWNGTMAMVLTKRSV